MIDTHYDLLSIAYVAYLKNDYSYLEKISKYFNNNNVTGVIANLYFMTEEEMKDELHVNYYQNDVSVLEMFKKAKEVLDIYLTDVDILYSIEGCDFIKDELELEDLYNSGLDSIVLTWNTKSKYASGNRSNQGLTSDGQKLLLKAIDLGMGIDLSHANEESFSDMIDVILEQKKLGKDIVVYASHSNSREICPETRNLYDYQLNMIKKVDGLVGVFLHRNFVVGRKYKNMVSQRDKEIKYLEHVRHVKSIVGDDNIMISTDDMDFCKEADSEYGEVAIFDYAKVSSCVLSLLSEDYDYLDVNKIMYVNAKKKIFEKIKNKRIGVLNDRYKIN